MMLQVKKWVDISMDLKKKKHQTIEVNIIGRKMTDDVCDPTG